MRHGGSGETRVSRLTPAFIAQIRIVIPSEALLNDRVESYINHYPGGERKSNAHIKGSPNAPHDRFP